MQVGTVIVCLFVAVIKHDLIGFISLVDFYKGKLCIGKTNFLIIDILCMNMREGKC